MDAAAAAAAVEGLKLEVTGGHTSHLCPLCSDDQITVRPRRVAAGHVTLASLTVDPVLSCVVLCCVSFQLETKSAWHCSEEAP